MNKGEESGPNTSDRKLQAQMDQGRNPEDKVDQEKQYRSSSSRRGEEEEQCLRNQSQQKQNPGETTSPRENDKQKIN